MKKKLLRYICLPLVLLTSGCGTTEKSTDTTASTSQTNESRSNTKVKIKETVESTSGSTRIETVEMDDSGLKADDGAGNKVEMEDGKVHVETDQGEQVEVDLGDLLK